MVKCHCSISHSTVFSHILGWTAGRAALTDNFDACRDLSGRRLRHVNAEQKLAEWAAQTKERELEKVGLKHILAQDKAAQREARAQVCAGSTPFPIPFSTWS